MKLTINIRLPSQRMPQKQSEGLVSFQQRRSEMKNYKITNKEVDIKISMNITHNKKKTTSGSVNHPRCNCSGNNLKKHASCY